MANKMQDLEQEILKNMELPKDIEILAELTDWNEVDPVFMNRVLSIAAVYEFRMLKLWDVYEEALEEYYDLAKHDKNSD